MKELLAEDSEVQDSVIGEDPNNEIDSEGNIIPRSKKVSQNSSFAKQKGKKTKVLKSGEAITIEYQDFSIQTDEIFIKQAQNGIDPESSDIEKPGNPNISKDDPQNLENGDNMEDFSDFVWENCGTRQGIYRKGQQTNSKNHK